MASIKSSWPEWQLPNWLDEGFRTSHWWVEQKKKDDGAEGLWRIHDGIYDLTEWANTHPGGKSWIDMTKGLDVTEVFEASHINPKVDKMLPKFFVRNAKTPRNSPYSFQPDGFYRTIKRRVYEKIKDHKRGPSLRMVIFIDACVAFTFLLSILAAKYVNYYIGILAGISLTASSILAHNFVHLTDNWRMYYFQLSLMSVTDWRIFHTLSHHVYTNTRHDLEILLMDPVLQWFPKEGKSWAARYLSWVYSPLFYSVFYFVQAISRFIVHGIAWEDTFSFILPVAMYSFSGASLATCLGMWVWVIICGSFVFGTVGFNAGHHHPDIFHEGDKARKESDWGLNQLDAVGDRIEVTASFPWAHLSFGDHSLHHLFPTLDHDTLPQLYPILLKTCSEFGVDFRFRTTWDMVSGQFRQLKRVEINNTPRENITPPIKWN